MDRRVQFLQAQLEREAIPARPLESSIPFFSSHGDEQTRGRQVVEELARHLQEYEERVAQMNSSHDGLQKRLQQLEEAKHVVRETAVFFRHAEAAPEQTQVRMSFEEDANAPLLSGEARGAAGVRNMAAASAPVDLEFVAGTIDRSHMATLERVLWRALRGNLYMNYAEI